MQFRDFIKYKNDVSLGELGESTVSGDIAPVTPKLGETEKRKLFENISINDISKKLKTKKIDIKRIEPIKNGFNVVLFNQENIDDAQDIIDEILYNEDVVFKTKINGDTLKYSIKYK